MAEIQVTHNIKGGQFEVQLEDQLAYLEYRLGVNSIILVNTEVPQALEGRGIGGTLVKASLEYARANQLGVVAFCPFVQSYLKRHPEYQDMVK